MNNTQKLREVKKHLETIKGAIDNLQSLSAGELKDYTKITVESKFKLYPEIENLINICHAKLNEVLNEKGYYR